MRKWLAGLLCIVGLSMGFMGSAIKPQSSQAASHSLRYFPSALRHTWYHYDGHGRYDRVTFGYKHYREQNYYDGWTVYHGKIHYRNLKTTHISHHPNWTFATPFYIHHMHWVNIYGWNQTAGDGEYYGVKVRHYHGHRIRVMSEANGAGIWTYQHYYATRKVARTLGDKHFKGVSYDG